MTQMEHEDDEPEIVYSPLCQRLTRNGVTVQVDIYGDSEGKWILEVVDEINTSHVWNDHFDTDEQALAQAIRALEEEQRKKRKKRETKDERQDRVHRRQEQNKTKEKEEEI
eukprot:GDKK01020715.1.p2 GENE.GDKK01020715.1~~GDKK01020715.1.p2  ORF type:complete len:111 (-),score=21.64 GDKK01020715.1:44-376(-)